MQLDAVNNKDRFHPEDGKWDSWAWFIGGEFWGDEGDLAATSLKKKWQIWNLSF